MAVSLEKPPNNRFIHLLSVAGKTVHLLSVAGKTVRLLSLTGKQFMDILSVTDNFDFGNPYKYAVFESAILSITGK